MPQAELDFPVVPAVLDKLLHGGQGPFAVIGVQVLLPMLKCAGELTVLIAKLAFVLLGEVHGVCVQVPVPKSQAGALHGQRKTLLGLEQFFLGASALGDVAHDVEAVLRAADVHQPPADLDGEGAAVRAPVLRLKQDAPVLFELLQFQFIGQAGLGCAQREEFRFPQFRRRTAVGLYGPVVGLHDFSVFTHQQDQVIGLAHHMLETLGQHALPLFLHQRRAEIFEVALAPQRHNAQSADENQQRHDGRHLHRLPARGRVDLRPVHLGHQEPRRVRHFAQGGHRGHTPVVSPLDDTADSLDGHCGDQTGLVQGKAQALGRAFPMAQIIEKQHLIAFPAHQEGLSGKAGRGPRLD